MAQDVGSTLARLLGLAEAAEVASHEFRYDDALGFGYEALALVGLDPKASPATWDQCTLLLGDAGLNPLARVTTAMAICAFRQADYMEALYLAQLELYLRRQLADDKGAGFALLGLGWCYQAVGLYEQALSHQFEALDALENFKPEAVAGPLNGIARIYLDLGQVDLALEYARRGLASAPSSPTAQRDTSTALRITGQALQAKGDLAAARAAFQECYERSDVYGQRLAVISLGGLCLEEGLLDEAQRYFEECLLRASPEMRERVQCTALLGLGRVFIARGEPERAFAPLTEAVARTTASGAPVETAAAHYAMSEALESVGRWEQALEHFKRFHEVNDRTLRQLSDRRTQVLQVQLDVERVRKDREIDRLRNVELAHAYADLNELHKQLEAQAARLERLSRTDALTGVPNRRAFDERLTVELQRSRRGELPVSLLMVDVDDFKLVNDTYSHAVGDEVLCAVADVLVACTREVDLVARIGGEEFVVLLAETGADGAENVARKIVAAIPRLEVGSAEVHVTVSVGVATCEPFDDESSLFKRADYNLYEAKRLGKNRVNA